jgi:hypothetical protein
VDRRLEERLLSDGVIKRILRVADLHEADDATADTEDEASPKPS